jgi:uncharacterized protein (TIGR03067 family)
MISRRPAVLLALALAAALAPADAPRKPPADTVDAVQRLQGTWVLNTAEYMGEWTDQDPTDDEVEVFQRRRPWMKDVGQVLPDLKELRTVFEFKGHHFAYRQPYHAFNGGGVSVGTTEGTFTVDAAQEPKVMTRAWVEDFGSRQEARSARCIYRVSDDWLQMAFALPGGRGGLPTQFTTAGPEEVVVLTFRRERR